MFSCKAMLGYCRSAASATVAETARVQAHTAPYFLFVTAAIDWPSVAGCSQTVQIIYAGLRSLAAGKAHAWMGDFYERRFPWTALINTSNSAHDISVKLSLFMCNHGICLFRLAPTMFQIHFLVQETLQECVWICSISLTRKFIGLWAQQMSYTG